MRSKSLIILGMLLTSSVMNAQMKLNGEGATFQYVIYSK